MRCPEPSLRQYRADLRFLLFRKLKVIDFLFMLERMARRGCGTLPSDAFTPAGSIGKRGPDLSVLRGRVVSSCRSKT